MEGIAYIIMVSVETENDVTLRGGRLLAGFGEAAAVGGGLEWKIDGLKVLGNGRGWKSVRGHRG